MGASPKADSTYPPEELFLVWGENWHCVYERVSGEPLKWGDDYNVYDWLLNVIGVEINYDFRSSDWVPNGKNPVSLQHAERNRAERLYRLTEVQELRDRAADLLDEAEMLEKQT